MDPFAVEWTPAAADDLERLDRRTQERIRRAVNRVADTGHGDIVRLRSRGPEWRLRIGPWRLRFIFDYGARTMRILRVLPRGGAYRRWLSPSARPDVRATMAGAGSHT